MTLYPFLIFSVIVITVSPLSARAEQDYPLKVQTTMRKSIEKSAKDHLRSVLEKLNLNAAEPKTLNEILQKNGFQPRDLAALKDYLGRAKTLPKASWRDDAILIREGRNSITLGSEELERGAVKVNGKEFQWNRVQPAGENLLRYDALFLSGVNSASLSSLITSAFADEDVLSLKIAGLRIYFLALSSNQPIQDLNTRVTALFRACEAPETPHDDPFSAAILNEALSAQKFTETVPLKNCADLKAYAEKVQTRLLAESKIKFPEDLCRNIDRLAKCSQSYMTEAVSGTKKKNLREPSTDDWQSEKANTADQTESAH